MLDNIVNQGDDHTIDDSLVVELMQYVERAGVSDGPEDRLKEITADTCTT